ncbi:hypothetical Protein YC6258_01318 [Gynuella sunshinyii YC6258]|uniref:Uncharacterized protein n=1 Tax=Gynuella sunshinyii YC6258 TaxID=1445510 RepID=A0A0C5VGN4_9GAMM|nr:hypothetical Protein YC6258_01318 [Gynuella sunshinyii YC6258]
MCVLQALFLILRIIYSLFNKAEKQYKKMHNSLIFQGKV